MCSDPVDDAACLSLPFRQQVEEAAGGPEQQHAHARSHDDQDGRRGHLPTVMAGRYMEAVGHKEGDEGEPEHHVEDDRRADALGPEGESGVRAAHARLGEQPVPQCGPGSGPAGRHVAQRERGHVDPEQPEPAGTVAGKDGVGELGVGGQRGDLQQDAEEQVGDVDVGEGVDFGPVAGQQRERDVEHEEEEHERPDAEAHLAAGERPEVPPPRTP